MKVLDKSFNLFITSASIQERIAELGQQLALEYTDKNPLMVVMLNGAFMFAADLVRACDFPCEIAFVKAQSYKGMESTGNVELQLGLPASVSGRHVLIVEDIIDSGETLHAFLPYLQSLRPASVDICALLRKPTAAKREIAASYIGFDIPTLFVVGYGLDYDGHGRNLADIYQLDDSVF